MIRYFCFKYEFIGDNLIKLGIMEMISKNNLYIPACNRKLYLELKPENIDGLPQNKYIENLIQYGISKQNTIRELKKFLKIDVNDINVFVSDDIKKISVINELLKSVGGKNYFKDILELKPNQQNTILINEKKLKPINEDFLEGLLFISRILCDTINKN